MAVSKFFPWDEGHLANFGITTYQQRGVIEGENVWIYSLDVVGIVTNDPAQTGLLDL